MKEKAKGRQRATLPTVDEQLAARAEYYRLTNVPEEVAADLLERERARLESRTRS